MNKLALFLPLAPHIVKRHRPAAMAFLLSLIVLSLALLLLWLGQLTKALVNDTLVVREITTVALPPPPPPPVNTQQTADTPQTLVVQGAGAAIQAVTIKIETEINISKPDSPQLAVQAPSWQPMSVNWDAFSLNQLDGMPSLLTSVKATLPKSLTRQGVAAFVVKLDVMIDENGGVSLIEVVLNPYPELKPEIDKIVKQSRFSPPKKDGQVVRARFIWPIEFNP